MKNRFQRFIENGDNPLGTWISIAHPVVIEINAILGFDFLLVDSEHTTMSLDKIESLIRATEAVSDDTEPVVRIPDNDPTTIKRVLDIGVTTIMIPMINSRGEAEALVESVRYPPEGFRGVAGSRATDYGINIDEYVRTANDSITTIVQIETQEGLNNVEEIASIDGIDALFIGPSDLSRSLEVFGQWDSEKFNEAVERILKAGRSTNVPVGSLVMQPDEIEWIFEIGFDFCIAGKDTNHLTAMGREVIQRYQQSLEAQAEGTDLSSS